MANTAPQGYVNVNADPQLQKIYANDAQAVPAFLGNTAIYITNLVESTIIRVSGPGEPAGNTSEVQFNLNGQMSGDDGLSYNPTTDSLTVLGNATVGAILTDSIKYANGVNWTFSSGTNYSNANVTAYLPTYTGNFNVNRVIGSLFAGSGANLTDLPGGNVTGTVANSTYATSAGTATSATTAATVTTAAQPNITAVGTLTSLSVTNKVTAGQLQGDGGNISNVTAANITGTVANASHATISNSSNSVAGGNVTGTVANATNSTNATFAVNITGNAQPNITSIGTLNGLTTSASTINLTNSSNVSLGPVANVHITGGSNGQVLRATSTNGLLEWATPSAGNLQDITTNGNTTDVAVSITNATASTNYNTGALKVSGGIGVGNTIHALSHIATVSAFYSGQYADFSSWTVPKFVGRDAGAAYIQGALINTSDTGSADWVTYGDQSDDANGWMDMGFTGTAFDDTNYTITKESDGYIFAQGMPSQGGNLVIATGQKGGSTHRDIVFATGGFLITNEKMRLNHEDSTLYVGAHGEAGGTNVVNIDTNGNLTVAGITSLGGVANVKITGGTDGQVLTTDGAGNLSFTTVSGGGTGDFTFTANVMSLTPGTDMVISLDDDNEDGYVLEHNVTTNGGTVSTKTKLDANEFTIETDVPGVGYSWSFDGQGNLQIPGNIYGYNSNVALASMDAGGHPKAKLISVSNGSSGPGPNIFTEINAAYTGANIIVYPGGSDVGSAKTWSFNNDGNLTVPGSIIPSANVSYDLGNADNRFRDLYLSGSTIRLGDATISTNGSNISLGNTAFSGNAVFVNDGDPEMSFGALRQSGNITYIESNIGGVYLTADAGSGISAKTLSLDISGTVSTPGDLDVQGNVSVTGTFTSAITTTGKIGYANGGTVTQTSTGQGVTLHQLTGQITLAKSSWSAGDLEIFNVNCNKVGTYDYVMAQVINGTESTFFNVVAFPYVPLANTFQIQVRAMDTTSATPLIQFYIMKASVT